VLLVASYLQCVFTDPGGVSSSFVKARILAAACRSRSSRATIQRFRIMQRFGDHNGEECELGGRTDGPNDRNRRTDFEQSCAPSLSGASSAVPSASAGYAAQPALSIARNGEVSRAASYPCR
jgi:hypothetical protein